MCHVDVSERAEGERLSLRDDPWDAADDLRFGELK